ncbi:MAG TPA: hypothetical protein VGO52_14325 [Hyphomonadaceae bacterium]|nr:hypothetical protein [Hyphomonadaceae bacterium]
MLKLLAVGIVGSCLMAGPASAQETSGTQGYGVVPPNTTVPADVWASLMPMLDEARVHDSVMKAASKPPFAASGIIKKGDVLATIYLQHTRAGLLDVPLIRQGRQGPEVFLPAGAPVYHADIARPRKSPNAPVEIMSVWCGVAQTAPDKSEALCFDAANFYLPDRPLLPQALKQVPKSGIVPPQVSDVEWEKAGLPLLDNTTRFKGWTGSSFEIERVRDGKPYSDRYQRQKDGTARMSMWGGLMIARPTANKDEASIDVVKPPRNVGGDEAETMIKLFEAMYGKKPAAEPAP